MPAKLPKWASNLTFHWTFRSAFIGIGFTLATAAIYFSWASQPLKRAKIGEIVAPSDLQSVVVDGRQVKPGSEIVTGQQLVTSQTSKAVLQQADQVFARIGTATSITLENECIQLNEGQMLLSTQGCLGAAIVQISAEQKAIYVIERLGTVGQIKVLAGQIEVSLPTNPAIESVTLTTNQKITLSLTGDEVGPVRLMLPSDVSNLLQGDLFQGFHQPLANQNLIADLPENLPPKAAEAPPVQKPVPPVAKAPTPPPPTASPIPVKPPAPTRTVYSGATHAASTEYSPKYERPQSAAEKPASYHPPQPRSTRQHWESEPSYRQYPYARKRSRSPYVTSAYRRKPPSYSPPAYTPPAYSPPAYSPPKKVQPVPEMAHPIEMPAPSMELPPAVHPIEAEPVLEPLPPPVMAEPPLEEAPQGF